MCRCVRDRYPKESFIIVKFADVLKSVCITLTGIEDQYSREGKNTLIPELGMTVGELQQRVGTEVGRAIHPDIWVHALFKGWNRYPNEHWIITDMRFPNEAHAVRSRGGFLIRIDGSHTGPQGRDPNHTSETALDDWTDWDYRFDNSTADMEELVHHARTIMTRLTLSARLRT
jgi:hypothetical protein